MAEVDSPAYLGHGIKASLGLTGLQGRKALGFCPEQPGGWWCHSREQGKKSSLGEVAVPGQKLLRVGPELRREVWGTERAGGHRP